MLVACMYPCTFYVFLFVHTIPGIVQYLGSRTRYIRTSTYILYVHTVCYGFFILCMYYATYKIIIRIYPDNPDKGPKLSVIRI